jgi:hypothetical protein
MIYNIRASVPFYHGGESSSIEASSEEDAKNKALELGQKIIDDIIVAAKELSNKSIEIHISLSDSNFLLKEGAIYLLSYYSKFIPAKCVNSWSRGWGRTKYLHTLKYLGSGKTLLLTGQNPKRIIKKLCDDGKINKPDCQTCPAKFNCYTVR